MRRFALIAGVVAAADQLTKAVVLQRISPEQPVVVVPGFFHLVQWHNTGAAWGIFPDGNRILAIVSVLTLIALVVFRRYFQMEKPGHQVAFGLIAGGIIGNVIDRLRFGHVVDFLDFHLNNWHWPAFNVADSGICVGVGLFLVMGWLADRKAKALAANPPNDRE